MFVFLYDGDGGVVGATQVRGVGQVELLLDQLLCRFPRLESAQIVERNVGRALDDPLAVGGRLTAEKVKNKRLKIIKSLKFNFAVGGRLTTENL